MSLAIAGALFGLTVVSLLPLTRAASPPTVPADLGAFAHAAIPLRTPMALAEAAGLWLLRGDATLRNARVRSYPRRMGEEYAEWAPQPLHSVERIELTGARLWLNSGRAPKPQRSPDDPSPTLSVLDALQRFAFETLVVADAQVTTQRVAGGVQTLDHVDAEIQAAPGKGITTASGSFQHRGEVLRFTAALRPAVTAAGKWSLPTRVTVEGRLFTAVFDGAVQFDRGGLRLDGVLDIGADRLSSLCQWLGVPLPAGVEGRRLSMRGDASWRDGVLVFETVRAEMDGQVAQGTLTLSVGGGRPFLDGALAFQSLDAGKLMTWFGLALAPPAPLPAGAPQLAERAARVTLFDGLDADLRLSADVVAVGGRADVAHAAISLTAKDGIVVADVADAEFANGLVSGQFRIDQKGPAVRWRAFGAVKHVDAAALTAFSKSGAIQPSTRPDLTGPVLTGPMTATFDLAGRGRTIGEVGASLDGEARLTMASGGMIALDLPALLVDARERRMFPFHTHQGRRGAFEHLEAKLALRQGAMLTEHVVLRHDGARVTIDGTIQAASGRMYVRLLTDHGQGLARTARIGRSQSVLVHGDLADPVVLLEDAPAAAPQPPAAAAAAPVVTPAVR